jgi:chemotaxis protein MotB
MGIAFAIAAAITRMTFHANLPPFSKAPPRDTNRPQGRADAHVISDDIGWLITLTDLTLLLLCFLVIWYVKNQEQNAPAQGAKAAAQATTASGDSEKPLPASAHASDWSSLREEIERFIAGAGMSDDVSIAAAPDEILLSFKDTVPFASGKADLRPAALPVLEKVAAVAVSRPGMHLQINGHTDDRPIFTVEFPSNWELSSARASRVARYLIEKGVHPARIGVHGFANHRPRVPNGNRTGRGANRRVELRLLRTSEAGTTQNSYAREPSDHEFQ